MKLSGAVFRGVAKRRGDSNGHRQLTEANTKRAEAIWAEYQRDHDLSGRDGQTVGIDPVLDRIWFGTSIEEVIAKRDADGSSNP
jgi:hypothetical protein